MQQLLLKLSLLKQFLKVLNPNSDTLEYLKGLFSKLFHAKIVTFIFIGLQIKHLMKNVNWENLKTVINGFLANYRA